jgi:hypothetical protein
MEKQGYRLRLRRGRRVARMSYCATILPRRATIAAGRCPQLRAKYSPMSCPLPHPHRRARRRELLANWLALLALLALGIV